MGGLRTPGSRISPDKRAPRQKRPGQTGRSGCRHHKRNPDRAFSESPTTRPKRANATLGGTRPAFQCRPDRASDLRRSPTNARRTPFGSPPSIFGSRRAPRACDCARRAVDGDSSFAPPRRFGRVHLARRFKCAPDLNTEVAQYRRARLRRVVVEKNVVAVSPQARLAANEGLDFADGRPPRRANRAGRYLAPHRGQLAGVNSLYVDGDRHSSIVNQDHDAGGLRHRGSGGARS